MSDTEHPAVPQEPAPEPAPEPVAATAETSRPRLRDLVFGLRSVVAVGLAGVVLGGLAGFGIHAATDGDDREGQMGRFGPGPGFPGMGPGQGLGQGPGGGWQQGPPPAPPSQDS